MFDRRYDIHIHIDPEALLALLNLKEQIMAALDELKTSIAALGTKIDAYVAANTTDVQALIDAAIAKDDADEEVDLQALKTDVMAIMNRIPPKFDPSGNAG